MPATVVVGLQWGDEGKGRIIDLLADDYDIVVRFQGGNNAGHTVVVDDQKYKLHFIPSGVIKGKKVAIGNGCVVNPDAFLEELYQLKKMGIKDIDITISERAHVITPQHIEVDSKKGKKIGTTGRGIGPCYTDKISRTGIRMAEYVKSNPIFKKYVGDVSLLVNEMLDRDKNVLLEGAQGALLCIDHGTYPYVTSSNTVAGGACTGVGISPKRISKVVGVAKAYTTRVGHGPFPTELKGSIGDHIREKGQEYGTTTGRPRRCGWFDSVAVRYSSRINGVDEIAITKLDVLSGLKNIKLCNNYQLLNEITREFPVFLCGYDPVYVTFEGWSKDLTKLKDKDKLPRAALNYLDALSFSLNNCDISLVGVGPERSQIIRM